jgi:hypothetical protein
VNARADRCASETGRIDLRVASGVAAPRDFAGEGTFQMAKQ